MITYSALSSSKELPPVSIRIPLPEPTPPLESGNKEATLIGRGIVVPGVGSPFKATAIPLVRDSHPLFPYRILAPRRSWDGHTGVVFGEPLRKSQGSSHCHARKTLYLTTGSHLGTRQGARITNRV